LLFHLLLLNLERGCLLLHLQQLQVNLVDLVLDFSQIGVVGLLGSFPLVVLLLVDLVILSEQSGVFLHVSREHLVPQHDVVQLLRPVTQRTLSGLGDFVGYRCFGILRDLRILLRIRLLDCFRMWQALLDGVGCESFELRTGFELVREWILEEIGGSNIVLRVIEVRGQLGLLQIIHLGRGHLGFASHFLLRIDLSIAGKVVRHGSLLQTVTHLGEVNGLDSHGIRLDFLLVLVIQSRHLFRIGIGGWT
jgi:hypothetical protein